MAGKHRGRRSHGAKCLYCKTHHGDGAPWWNKAKDGWAIAYKIDGKTRYRLLAKGWEGHDEAIRLWKEKAFTLTEAEPIVDAADGEDWTIEQLVHHRLEYLKNNAGQSTYDNARGTLTDFCNHDRFGFAKTTIREMRDGGIARIKLWAAAHRWNDSTKSLVFATIKALFNYATGRSEDGLAIIETSPVAKLNTGRTRVKPRARLAILSAEQEAAILANADPRGIYLNFGLAFRSLLATGVRPEELCTLTAANVHKDTNGDLYWSVRHKNIKRTGSERRVYLTPEMQRVTAEQMKLYPDGTLFRNNWGKPWDVDSLYRALRRVTARPACAALGLDKYDNGKRTDGSLKKEYHYVIYTCRHTFAHRHLTGFYKRDDGTPLVLNYGEVGELMGNSAAEVERTYGKLVKATTHLSSLLRHA